jgi:23S rRNA (cytidine2498-2'-O)-methyltransferase
MAMLVSSLLYSVRRGGTVIITLKLMHGKAFQAIKETVQSFQTHLTLCRAKQLFHNREELTLYFTKNG